MTTSGDIGMMPLLLSSLVSNPAFQLPQEIMVQVRDDTGFAQLESILTEALEGAPNIGKVLHDDPWSALSFVRPSQAVNLRQGELAPPLRLDQYWPTFRLPGVAALLALSLFTLVSAAEIYHNNKEYKNIQATIEEVYRSAMPQGMLVDAEQQLRSQLDRLRGNAGQERIMPMLDKIAALLLQDGSTQVHRLGFSATGSELELAITAKSNADILALSESLKRVGLSAQARNLSPMGDRQQASIIIGGEQ